MKRKPHTNFIMYEQETIELLPDLTLVEQIIYKRVAAMTELNGSYNKPLSDLAYWIRSSEDTARRALHNLVKAGLLDEIKVNGKPTEYKVIPLAKCYPLQIATPCKLQPHPLQNATPHTLLDNNRYFIDNRDINISMGERKKCEQKTKEKQPAKSTKKTFQKPTPAEVQAYCDERQNGISGEEFCDFYQSKGWMIGKNHMKDWKAAVRTWERSRKNNQIITKQHDTSNANTTGATANAADAKPYSRIQELANTKFNLD